MFLGVSGIRVFLPARGIIQIGRLALFELFALVFVDVLARRGHQRRINGLPTKSKVAVAVQLLVNALQQNLRALYTQALAKPPITSVGYAGRPPLRRIAALDQHLNQAGQRGEVDVLCNDPQWVTNFINFALATSIGEQVKFKRAAGE